MSTVDAGPAGNDASRQWGTLFAQMQDLHTQIDRLRDPNVFKVFFDPTMGLEVIVDGSPAAVPVHPDVSRPILYDRGRHEFGYHDQQCEFKTLPLDTVGSWSTVNLPVVPCDGNAVSVMAHVSCTVLFRGLAFGRCVCFVFLSCVCVCVCVGACRAM
jgi:hypothetical protein